MPRRVVAKSATLHHLEAGDVVPAVDGEPMTGLGPLGTQVFLENRRSP